MPEEKAEFPHRRRSGADAAHPNDPKAKPPCLRKTLGLVGFHVGHKTEGRRQWIWTSFEHMQNVPEQRKRSQQARAKDRTISTIVECRHCPVNADAADDRGSPIRARP